MKKLVFLHTRRCFTYGFIAHFCLMNLYQDLLGKERYLSTVQTGWIDIPWSVWIVFGALVTWHYDKTRRWLLHEVIKAVCGRAKQQPKPRINQPPREAESPQFSRKERADDQKTIQGGD